MPHSSMCLLILHGGGWLGLSVLMIFEQLVEAIEPEAPPIPCYCFYMIDKQEQVGRW